MHEMYFVPHAAILYSVYCSNVCYELLGKTLFKTHLKVWEHARIKDKFQIKRLNALIRAHFKTDFTVFSYNL